MNVNDLVVNLENQLKTLKTMLQQGNITGETPVMNGPDMGLFHHCSNEETTFSVERTYKRGKCHYKYQYLGGEELTERGIILLQRTTYPRN